ncbi:MAG: L-lactate dehydrogenase [Acidimicrobiia bacterium]|nr:L-lactate dehydrogenase [Acidimicrobiia bacterium]
MRPDRPLHLVPATPADYRARARRRLPRQLFDYLDGGAGRESTMDANAEAFDRVLLRQRVMVDVAERDTSVELLGQHCDMPVVLAPVGLAGMFATRAEVQAARAAQRAAVPFCESTVSICSLEEVAANTTAPFWFQLYVMRDRSYAEGLMERAHRVGCPVLVLTVDLAVVGARYRDVQNGMVGSVNALVKARRALDYGTHPKWLTDVAVRGKPHTFGNLEDAVPGAKSPEAFREWVDAQFDPSVTWDDIDWVRAHWPGKLVLKGIMDAEDARRAVDSGTDGIVVSNHGGRQLDGVPATIDALPAVVEAVGDRTTVLVDGGIRSGTDVLRACARGADACMIGRPWAYAVAADGTAGVRRMLATMQAELRVAMGLTGVTKISESHGALL